VRLAFDSHGLDIEEPEDVDVSQARVKIVEIIEPGALDIDVAELL
jgi:hypothetical protein